MSRQYKILKKMIKLSRCSRSRLFQNQQNQLLRKPIQINVTKQHIESMIASFKYPFLIKDFRKALLSKHTPSPQLQSSANKKYKRSQNVGTQNDCPFKNNQQSTSTNYAKSTDQVNSLTPKPIQLLINPSNNKKQPFHKDQNSQNQTLKITDNFSDIQKQFVISDILISQQSQSSINNFQTKNKQPKLLQSTRKDLSLHSKNIQIHINTFSNEIIPLRKTFKGQISSKNCQVKIYTVSQDLYQIKNLKSQLKQITSQRDSLRQKNRIKQITVFNLSECIKFLRQKCIQNEQTIKNLVAEQETYNYASDLLRQLSESEKKDPLIRNKDKRDQEKRQDRKGNQIIYPIKCSNSNDVSIKQTRAIYSNDSQISTHKFVTKDTKGFSVQDQNNSFITVQRQSINRPSSQRKLNNIDKQYQKRDMFKLMMEIHRQIQKSNNLKVKTLPQYFDKLINLKESNILQKLKTIKRQQQFMRYFTTEDSSLDISQIDHYNKDYQDVQSDDSYKDNVQKDENKSLMQLISNLVPNNKKINKNYIKQINLNNINLPLFLQKLIRILKETFNKENQINYQQLLYKEMLTKYQKSQLLDQQTTLLLVQQNTTMFNPENRNPVQLQPGNQHSLIGSSYSLILQQITFDQSFVSTQASSNQTQASLQSVQASFQQIQDQSGNQQHDQNINPEILINDQSIG